MNDICMLSNNAHLYHSFLVNETSAKCLGKHKIWLIVWYKNNVLMILCNCLCQFSLQLKHSIYQTCIQSWIGALHSLKFVNDYIAISLNDTVYMWNNWKQLHIEPMTYHFVHTLHCTTRCISIEIVFPSLQLSSPKRINSERLMIIAEFTHKKAKSLEYIYMCLFISFLWCVDVVM